MQEVAQYLELKCKISLQWMDARVSFYNIKPEENMNALTLDEQQALWTPTIVFWNTKDQLIRTHLQVSNKKEMGQPLTNM